MELEKYKDLSGRGGVTGYKIFHEGIIVQFQNRDIYLYDYIKPGKYYIDQMKTLAKNGKGLTTYINQNIRENYRKKLE
jgi:hypothetical protein